MKKYSRIIFLFAAVLAAGLAVFVRITSNYRSHVTDILMINDIIQTVKENINDIYALDDKELGTDIKVFDSGGFMIYSSDGNDMDAVSSVEESVNKGYICLAINDGSRFLGTAVIPDPDKSGYDLIRAKLITAVAVIVAILIAAVIFYGIYVYRTIIVPFGRMETFAEKVANGDLDVPVLTQKSNIFGAFTESFDIMREELKASRSREDALKIKEKEMIASLSHDLKTPITGIKLICELLSVKISDSYITGKVNDIHQKAEQLNILVSDLLSSTLDDLSEMNVECREEEASVLHELVAEHDTRSLAKEDDIPECIISIDRIRLSQVIGNIISNSYKYAGTSIDVGYCINDRFLDMSLRDHGDGVPEVELPLITDKFYRGKVNSAGKDGNGLGLYIASELMKRMNGELICSCADKGMTITLLIPLA